MTKINRPVQHHIDEPLELLKQILQRMLDDANANIGGKFSKEKMQKFNRLCFIFKNFLEQTRSKNIPLEYEFYEKASLLVNKISIVRGEDAFVAKANATDVTMMKKMDAIVADVYAAVYSNQLVQQVMGNVAHVATKIAQITDKVSGQKLVDEMWEKVRKSQVVSDEADKKLSAKVQKLQELYETKPTQMPAELVEEFKQVSMDAYLLGAASTLALEELETAKEHLAKLIAAGN